MKVFDDWLAEELGAENFSPIVLAGVRAGLSSGDRSDWFTLRGETDHEFFRQGAEPGKRGWGDSCRLGLCPRRRSG